MLYQPRQGRSCCSFMLCALLVFSGVVHILFCIAILILGFHLRHRKFFPGLIKKKNLHRTKEQSKPYISAKVLVKEVLDAKI